MRLDMPIVPIFEYPIDAIVGALPGPDSALWDKVRFRQNNYDVHSATRSIVFDWLSNSWKPQHPPAVAQMEYAPPELASAVRAFAAALLQRRPGKVVKLMLAELPAGGTIRPHVDVDPAMTLAHRCHLPIVSNAGVVFIVDAVSYLPKPGVCFEFDNTRRHSVSNSGSTPRVHLMCDILPLDE